MQTTADDTKTQQCDKQPQYFKVLKHDLTHRGFVYKTGLNVDTKPFDPAKTCGGGLYFTDKRHLPFYMFYGSLVARVTLPPDAQFVRETNGKYKADKIILSDIIRWRDLSYWDDPVFCELAVKSSSSNIQHVQNQTRELCLEAVKNYGCSLKYVRNQTDEICLAAVKNNGRALKYVHHQTDEICLAAVQNNLYAKMYVTNVTPEIQQAYDCNKRELKHAIQRQ